MRDRNHRDFEDYQIERDFERRYGRRPTAGEADVRGRRDARFGEPRSWWARTTDEVGSWFGRPGALSRRQRDEAAGDHRGKGPKTHRRDDDRIVEEIGELMRDDPDLDASDIEVLVTNGEVTLNGAVRVRADKRLAEDTAAAAAGVTHVQNNLRVGTDPEAP